MTMLNAGERFFIGTYTQDTPGEGIYTAVLDSESGAISSVELAGEALNPSFLAQSPDGKFLYAALETKGGRVAAFSVGDSGSLTLLNEQPCGGSGTAHISVTPSGSHVLAANYGGGDIAVLPVAEDGSLKEASAIVKFEGSGPDVKRQKAPHAHGIYASIDGRFIYVCDLGTDRIHTFRFEDGNLTALEPGKVPPGSGPRHLAFSEDQRFIFVGNELTNTVSILERDTETGLLTLMDTIPGLPEGGGLGVSISEIRAHPDGKWLYLAIRGHDSLSVFEIGGNGALSLKQNIPAEVKQPRGFGLSPDGRWLVAAGQKDGTLKTFAIDPASGTLKPVEGTIGVPAPADVLFMPPREERGG